MLEFALVGKKELYRCGRGSEPTEWKLRPPDFRWKLMSEFHRCCTEGSCEVVPFRIQTVMSKLYGPEVCEDRTALALHTGLFCLFLTVHLVVHNCLIGCRDGRRYDNVNHSILYEWCTFSSTWVCCANLLPSAQLDLPTIVMVVPHASGSGNVSPKDSKGFRMWSLPW